MIKYNLLIFILITLFSCDSHKDYKLKEIENNTNIFYNANSDINDSIARDLFNSGLKFIQNSDFIIADSLFKLADNREPNNVIILNALALNSYNITKETNNDLFVRAIQIDKTFSPTYSNYAYCLNCDQQYSKAIRYLKEGFKYVDNDRKRAIFNYTLSISYIRLDSCDLAKKHIKEAIRLENDKIILKDYKEFKKYIYDNCK